MYTQGYQNLVPTMVTIHNNLLGRAFLGEDTAQTPPSSSTAEGRVAYFPVILPGPCWVRRVWWANGSTVNASATIEVGVYSDSGRAPASLLVSGSATQSGTETVQFADCTDTYLPLGRYWLALVPSTTSSVTFFRSSLNSGSTGYVYRYHESGSTLPSTATPTTGGYSSLWMFGFSTVASP